MTFNASDLLAGSSSDRSTTTVVHRYSDAGVNPRTGAGTFFDQRCKTTNTGSLTAGVLSGALINISGTAGAFYDCALITNDATARTLRLQIVADGVTVFDATSASVSASGAAVWAVANGAIASGESINTPPIVFNSTLTVKVASSVTETDKTKIAYTYVTRA